MAFVFGFLHKALLVLFLVEFQKLILKPAILAKFLNQSTWMMKPVN